MDKTLIAGVDIGGTHIRISCYNSEMHPVKTISADTLEILNGENQGIKLGRFIWEFCKDFKPDAVAVGIPGTLDKDGATILNTPNLPGLCGCTLKNELEQELKIPVFLENDTIMMLHGDLYELGIENKGHVLGVYIGTGLGCVLFINGKIPKGKTGVWFELGHFPIPGRNELCTCGNRGCAENYVSGRRLLEICTEKYPGTHISGLFTQIKGDSNYYSFIEDLSCLLAGTINLTDPDVVILGGGVVSMEDFPRHELESAIYEHTMKPHPAETLDIRYSSGKNTGTLGAAIYAVMHL